MRKVSKILFEVYFRITGKHMHKEGSTGDLCLREDEIMSLFHQCVLQVCVHVLSNLIS